MAQDFFEELQSEFLDESSYLLEQYEEAMLELETGDAADQTLAQIFRVAHSIKGGAAAVGFMDLNRFAHVAEDLLAFLRLNPYLISPDLVSLLLQSGDALKNRINALKTDRNAPWDVSHLQAQLVEKMKSLTQQIGEVYDHPGSSPSAHESTTNPIANSDTLIVDSTDSQSTVVTEPIEDHTNYDLLAELQAEFGLDSNNMPKPTEAPSSATSSSDLSGNSEVPKPELKVIENKTSSSLPPTQATKTSSQNKNQSTSASIKIDVNRIDSVLDTVGEIVVLKNQLLHDENIKNANSTRLASIVDQIDKLVRDLYDRSLAMRMTPLKSMFVKIQRIVRDVSLQLGKDVNLVIQGEETEVERTVFELLADPMVHLVRNALDHGIEVPEARLEKGKPKIAQLTVSAKQQGGNVVIDIKDDGAGINRDRILQKAIDKKLIAPGRTPESYTDDEVFQMIFLPGFSTAEKVTDLSGRGVGLDVVKSNLERARGKLEIFSKINQGSTFRLVIPLSTAITDGIIVGIGEQSYILPIYSIREIVRVTEKELTHVAKLGSVMKVRDQLIPIIDSTGLFNCSGKVNFKESTHQLMLVLESVHGFAALPVTKIIGQAQVVVKPAQVGTDIPEVSGAAILGDGRTVLILDPQAMMTKMHHNESLHDSINPAS
jgi:two-component system, chemotaxis family, sensor kinase CheA